MEAIKRALSIKDLWSDDQFGTVAADVEETKKALQDMQEQLQAAINKATL